MTLSPSVPRLVRSDGREIPIEKDLTIGRLPECNIQIEDALLSRTHARLELSGTQVTITDLGSHNGTWVNDKKILLPTSLVEGDKVRIGHSIFIFRAAVIPAVVAGNSSGYLPNPGINLGSPPAGGWHDDLGNAGSPHPRTR